MAEPFKLPYYDLKFEHRAGRVPECVGRTDEQQRIERILGRRLRHHAAVLGPPGVGKTRLLFGLGRRDFSLPELKDLNVAYVDLSAVPTSGVLPQHQYQFFQDGFATVERTILLLDNFGSLASGNQATLSQWLNILTPLLNRGTVRLVLTATVEEYGWIENAGKGFLSQVELMELKTPPPPDIHRILTLELERLSPPKQSVAAEAGVLQLIAAAPHRFPSLGQLPSAAVHLLDEVLTEATMAQDGQLTLPLVERVVAQKVGVPESSLKTGDREILKNLPELLKARIVGQEPVLDRIVSVLQRARLGLRNQNRPLGSFLALGPSGVGKTETAKLLAEQFFGRPESFLRLDMSEFSEAHTVSRLIGSPPGYTGSDAGGQLTNHFQREPYSLVLLDEMEKAHPKIFDIFLQALDDGRLTSARGETVSLTNAIFMATSNLGVEEIISGHLEGQPIADQKFLQSRLLPVLTKHFRTEFLNRFDAILVFQPLSVESLTDIALLEVGKIEERVKQHRIRFSITREQLEGRVRQLADPRLGARPVKRFVEETCETLISEALLNSP